MFFEVGSQVKSRKEMPKIKKPGCTPVYLDAMSVDDLVGKILTIIDASFPVGKQCEALKSIIKQEIWGWAVQPQDAATLEQMDKWSKEAEIAPEGAEFPLITYPRK